MTDGGYTGYVFAFSRDDLDPSDGLEKTRVIAVAQSADDAMRAASEAVGRADFELLDVGAEILAQAREMGVEDDKAIRI
ncbi:MAG: hypothetical protein INR68_18590 [Methylobacterium mesophilicum]|nr:hypothetical protein [Methylobacterium mesophilicum]